MNKASHRVAFLDGLRGWGALTVVAYHLFIEIYPPSPPAGAALYRIALFNGPLAVVIFFIVSGYSLSIGFLQTDDRWRLKQIFVGRYFRLAIPILLATVIVYAAAKLGLILDFDRSSAAQSLWPAVRFALFDVFFNNHTPTNTPIPQLWTMPVELSGSALVVALLWMTGVRRIRFAAYTATMGILVWLSPFLAAFMVGTLFAEISVSSAAHRVRSFAGYLIAPAIVAAAFLPGQGQLAYLVVATLITFSAVFSKTGSRFLSNSLSSFLGKISFPLYLLHGLVIFTYGTWIMRKVETPAVLILAHISTVLLALAAAWALRWIDTLGIGAARFVGGHLLNRPAPTPPKSERPYPGRI